VHGAVTLAGWAFDEHPTNAGLAAIHVWAAPVGGGAPTFVGLATLGISRPDVGVIFGAQYAHAGFSVAGPALPAGAYDLVLFGQNAATGLFDLVRVVRVTVTP
jgi:hypothetical protein